MGGVALISELYAGFSSEIVDRELVFHTTSVIPHVEALATADVVVVLDEPAAPDIGLEIGGSLAVLLGRGKLVLVAYNVRIGVSLEQLLRRVADVGVAQAFDRGGPVRSVAQAFNEYFTLFGVSAVGVSSDRGDVVAEPLAWLPHHVSGVQDAPAAARFLVGRGSLYVLPFHVADLAASHDTLIPAMLDAVANHEAVAGGADFMPAYLDGLRLPGEDECLEAVAQLTRKLQDASAEVDRLRSFRSMAGSASGARLERLVIEALNVILSSSGYQAVDRPDTGAEDFWIVGPAGDFALVEVKGINTSVRRTHVNQVDDHRSRLGRDDGQPAGLLVINTQRKADALAPKQEDVHRDIRAHAIRQNVLIVTGLDLYELLGLALSGEDVARPLIEGLSAGGGWLRVRDGVVQVLQ